MTDQTHTLTIAQVIEQYQTMRRLEKALAAHGATTFQLALLATIATAPVVRLGDLAQTLGVMPASVTIGLNRLEQRGLVERVTRRSPEGPADRRRVVVGLTDRGRELLASLATIEVGQ